ncbi:helix-turn-helix transcriptional regulator [Citrobacter werkmanii]|uniref:helix-turn-helix transcriptional regulator n=1 Tax=Citrobacter werkmanii TaxID=67827 RepID=UPI0012736C94|nr:AraC family transcriptional regulator [Salmonella enterica]EAZ9261381.1 AraC family transcriptional regulator [Salmonella enterica]EBN2521026.1 AraC family transcriptional regulator [Salmonella enterica]
MKNIHLYNYVLVYTKNCELILSHKDNEFRIGQSALTLIEKNTRFDVRLIRKNAEVPYDAYFISDDELSAIRNVVNSLTSANPDSLLQKRKFEQKIFNINITPLDIELFYRLKTGDDRGDTAIYNIAYLLAKTSSLDMLSVSLNISASATFTDKLSNMIAKDLSRKWKLGDVSDEFNLSEITIRKKLESENTTFNKLLLDLRMNAAIKHIAQEGLHINMVSNMIGFSSTSYFIRVFKSYFGITPKKFHSSMKGAKALANF